MPVTLELAQTVAIGAFNPHVVTPEWLVCFAIYPENGDFGVQLGPLGSGTAFEYEHDEVRVQWQVDDQKLSVSASDPTVDCGGTVSKVLELLPHTPVWAVGHNFHFSAVGEEWGERPIPMLGARKLADFEEAEQVRWVGAFRRGETRIEVTLAHESDAAAILFNHHRAMDLEAARKAKTPEERIKQAREAAQKFREDFEASRELLRSLFKMEFNVDSPR